MSQSKIPSLELKQALVERKRKRVGVTGQETADVELQKQCEAINQPGSSTGVQGFPYLEIEHVVSRGKRLFFFQGTKKGKRKEPVSSVQVRAWCVRACFGGGNPKRVWIQAVSADP